MNTRLPRLAAVAAVLALGASAAFAHDVQYEGDMYHRISHQTSQSARTAAGQQDELGYAVTGPAARVVVLDGSVRHLNVTQGESITFRLPSKERVGWEFETQSPPTVEEFTWNFDTLGTPTFNLAEVARNGIDVGQVEVHVAPNPLYGGG